MPGAFAHATALPRFAWRRTADSFGSAINLRELPMILEVATLDVRPGQDDAYEAAFAQAAPIIAAMPGYLSHTLQRCIERPSRYVLLVEWTHLEAHTVGFRGSPDYQRWKRLLHHFYDPFPTVEHYARVLASGG